ncbi:polycystin family receptor for egg jelly-like [Periplaneta americana]|uniref:polycystin family receptor for egg jelly-like n=1 Tax=Periplaneta americana TaxID=6978 RepID=UPI0037E98C6A
MHGIGTEYPSYTGCALRRCAVFAALIPVLLGKKEALPCDSKPCRMRGVCKNQGDSYTCECYEQFYENPDNDCMDERNHCSSNPCTNGGTCQPVWGNYFCVCEEQYHGRHCEKQNKGGIIRTSRPEFLYDTEQYIGAVSIPFLIFDGGVGTEFSLTYYIEIDGGDDVTFSGDSALLEDGLDPSDIKKGLSSSHMKEKVPEGKKKVLYFPFRYKNRQGVTKFNASISVQVKNAGEDQFAGRYPVLLSTDPGICRPVVTTVKDCGRSTAITKWERGKNYTVRGHSVHGCSQDSKLNPWWTRYTLSNDAPYPFFLKVKSGRRKTNSVRVPGTVTHTIESYSLRYGVYVLEQQVVELLAANVRARLHLDFDMVGVQKPGIVADPLIAELRAGHEQTVSEDSQVVLDASGSRDPNEPDSVRDHLVFTWTCAPATAPGCENMSAYSGQQIIRLTLPPGSYEFTVKVSVDESKAPTVGTYPEKTLPQPGTYSQKVTVKKGVVTKLSIECVKNCDPGGKVSAREVLILKVNCLVQCAGSSEKGFYRWTASNLELNDDNTELGTQVDRLIVKENVLTPGQEYSIHVKGGFRGEAALVVTTRRALDLGDRVCTVTPSEGISGVDTFNLDCDYPEEHEGFPVNFEVYQTPDPGDPNTEVLISYRFKPHRTGLVLMAGPPEDYKTKISIRVEDHFGQFFKKEIAEIRVRPLTDSPDNTDVIDAARKLISGEEGRPSLQKYISGGDMSGAVRLISALTVALDSREDTDEREKQLLKDQFINALDQVPMFDISPVKQVATTLHLVLGAGRKEETPGLLHGSVRTASQILEQVTGHMFVHVRDSYEELQLPTEELMELAEYAVQCSAALVSNIVSTMDAVRPSTAAPEDASTTELEYPAYSEMDAAYIDTAESFRDASKQTVTAMDNIGKAVLFRLGEEQKEKTVDSGYVTTWIKADKPTKLADKLIGQESSGQGVKIPRLLAQEIEDKEPYIGLQVSIMKKNPFQWDPDSDEVNTEFVVANLWDRALDKPFRLPAKSVPISLYVAPHVNSWGEDVVEGSVTVPSSALHNDEELEDCITVHKSTAAKGQTPYLQFKPLHDASHKLRVVVTTGMRPSLEHFDLYSETIPHQAPSEDGQLVVFVDGVCQQDKDWFYVGILPHPDTFKAVNASHTVTVNYSFEIKTMQCRSWDMETMRWNNEDCQVGEEVTLEKLHCRCSHLSVFSGSLLVPATSMDPFKNIQLFLIIAQNFVIPTFLLVILALYFLILVWARWKDRRDVIEGGITVLQDNYPGSSYTYLVAVYTGYQWKAGTTSNVGIQLIGDEYKSTAHILADSSRRLHSRSADNWFVLFTARRLGNITHIRLWHDNSGHSPSWFCERVVVRDVQQRAVWSFVVRRWLSVVHGHSSLHCVVPTATAQQLSDWRQLIASHVVMGFQESHVWTCIFMRHPRSGYTRVQRLTAALSALCTSMLLSMLLCGPPTGDPSSQLGEGSFQFPARQLIMTLAAAFLSSPITFLFVLLFRKTAPKKEKYFHEADVIMYREDSSHAEDDIGQISSESKHTGKEKKKWWESFLTFVTMEPLIIVDTTESGNGPATRRRADQHGVRNTKIRKWKKQDKKSYWFPHWLIYVVW